jgi:hypothetical protein
MATTGRVVNQYSYAGWVITIYRTGTGRYKVTLANEWTRIERRVSKLFATEDEAREYAEDYAARN